MDRERARHLLSTGRSLIDGTFCARGSDGHWTLTLWPMVKGVKPESYPTIEDLLNVMEDINDWKCWFIPQ